MNEQDAVMILTGNWVRGDSGKWIFDVLNKEGINYVFVKSDLEYDKLVALVKDSLGIESRTVTMNLAYQYPAWMQIDDGDGSTPQFISDDHEVEVFVQMRRKIKEVNLCVTIAQCNDGINTAQRKPHFSNVTYQMLCNDDEGDNNTFDDSPEDEWSDFALSETPLTCPPITNAVGGSFHVRVTNTIPSMANGIVIREPQPILRLQSPPPCGPNRGKGKAVLTDDVHGREQADSGGPKMFHRHEHPPDEGGPSRGVKRRLFSPESVESEAEVEAEPSQGTSIPCPIHVTQTTEVGGDTSTAITHWTRFQDSLQQLLDDETSQNALFGRDALLVVESLQKDGKIM